MLAVAGNEYAVGTEVASALRWLFRRRRASLAEIGRAAPDVPIEVIADVVNVLICDGVVWLAQGRRDRELGSEAEP